MHILRRLLRPSMTAWWQIMAEESNSIVALQGVSMRLSVQAVQAHVRGKMLTHPGYSSASVRFARTRVHHF